jgi:small GTP-binding protein
MTTRGNYKFIVIGSSGVGKTAILKRLVDNTFTGESQTTIGVEYVAATIPVDEHPIKLQIWDTAGQERFRSIAKAYFRAAVGVMLVFDLTDRKSFEELAQWLNDVHSLCDPNAIVTLIGNKLDLVDQRVITVTEAQHFAQLHELSYMETSALGGNNIHEAFQKAAASVHRKNAASQRDDDKENNDDLEKRPKPNQKCCF